MKNKGLLIVFSGPSGSGKGTVLKKYFETHNNAKFSVSATTRNPRPGEVDGKDYFFITKDEFIKLKSEDGFLESAEFCGNCYGTPKKPIENWQKEGYDVFLEIEVQGGAQVQNKVPECVGIFNCPPSLEELERRLRNRGTETEDVIKNRLNAAKDEISKALCYNYIIVNDSVDKAAERLGKIIESEKLKSNRNREFIERMINND